MNAPLPQAKFSTMEQSTKEDWAAITQHFVPFAKNQAERVLAHLMLLDGDCGGYPVDRLTHSLQTATRAFEAGEDEEYVVCALLHDIGDTLGAYNHADVAAVILRPYISDENHWMIEKHGIFQGYYFFHHLGLDRDQREQFRGHPHFERTARFCALYDGPAFDINAPNLPLDFFKPMVERVLAKPRRTIYATLDK
jgi:predicted HD phosphohydrolase